MSRLFRAALAAAASIAATTLACHAQSLAEEDQSAIPPVIVEQKEPAKPAPEAKKASAPKKPTKIHKHATAEAAAAPAPESVPQAASGTDAVGEDQTLWGTRSGRLTVPTIGEGRGEINQTPGGVALILGTSYQESTPAVNLKDIVDFTPGVFAQTKWGTDTRLSIRGSGLSRNFHLRSVQLFMDGIPMNTSDGYGDFAEIDPTLYRYVEVYKGANALQYGANSLGGAINFVLPSGYTADRFMARTDAGSFGFSKVSLSAGAVSGKADYFIGGTWQNEDGFRDHSAGDSVRGSANFGYRIGADAETRFYINGNHVEQEIPGEVTRQVALTDPKSAAAINVVNDWQRNIDSVRVANKTALRLAPDTLLEFGAFNVDRHLMHPIFLWLDYQYRDFGGFARLTDERRLNGYRNRLIGGLNIINGNIDADNFAIGPNAVKGPLVQSADQRAENESFYIEDSFYFLPRVALVGGTQFLHATRDQEGILNTVSGNTDFNLWSPKAGVLFDVDETWQIFGNISRSAEVPSFGEGGGLIPFTDIKAQRATTYEIGTRGRRPDYTWDIALYRADVRDELQCLGDGTDFCTVVNAPRTVHQGAELGFGATLLKSIFTDRVAAPDRLWLNTAYTFNDFFFADDPVFGDNELPGIPRHYLRSELLYKHPGGFFFGPNIEWVPEAYYVDNANTLPTKAYAIWGIKAGYEGERFNIYVEGRNLSDLNYIATTDIVAQANPNSALFWPGNGRAIYAGLQMKW
jgi:iron complex outermembrane receptor protein